MTDEQTDLQARLDQADWSLQMLNAGQHKHLVKLLGRITSDFRVVKDARVLEKAHGNSCSDDELHQQSEAIGTIRSSFKDGKVHFSVYSIKDSTDPQQARLLALSQRELLNAIFDAIGLQKKSKSKTTVPGIF